MTPSAADLRDEQVEAPLVMLALARLARLGQERQALQPPAAPAPQVVCLRRAAADAGLAPLVFIHPAGGSIISYKELSRHLAADRSVYGIQSQPDAPQSSLRHACLDDLADSYVQQLDALGLGQRVVLSGYSLGGAVAFEMARRLTARGSIVEMVIVIDTPVRLAAQADATGAVTPHQLLMFGTVLTAGVRADLALDASDFEGLAAGRQVGVLIDRLRAMKLLGDADDSVYRSVYELVRHNEGLQRRHVPQGLYGGRVQLIRAAAESSELRRETGALYDDPSFGWAAHCEQPVDCVRVPGSHFNLMYPPFIATLGRAVQQCLDDRCAPDPARLFLAQVRARPEHIALRAVERAFSYRELHAHAVALADRLTAAGARPGDVVAVCGERSAGHVVALLAITWLGAAYLPLDPAQPRERTDFLLADAGPRLLLVDAADPAWDAAAMPVMVYDRTPPATARDASATEPPAVAPESLMYIMYTSGTTGTPKGVCVTREAVVQRVNRVDYVRLGPDACLLQHSNLCFDASTFELWGSLLSGATGVLMPHARPSSQQFEEALTGHGVTTLFLTSALFRDLVEHRPQALRGLREVLVGGEAMPASLARQALQAHPGLHFIHVYGPTECTVFALSRRFTAAAEVGEALPLGQPLPHTTVHVLDADGRPAGPGVEGELLIGGSGLARGYLRRDELTCAAFVEHRDALGASTRLYRTGDIVVRGADGELLFKGRRDRQVKLRGFRVELGEVEAAVERCPAVERAAVKIVPADTGEKLLVAYAVPRAGALAPDAAADARRLGERVAHWEQVYSHLLYKSLGSSDQAGQDPALNSAGWTSSFDGRPVPAVEMEEQFAATATRVLALAPKHVLDIGCGTGMLLFRVAPHCASYTATDFSAAVLEYVGRRATEAGLDGLSLHHLAAQDLPAAPPGGFDTVILNSVTEHFPSLQYLDDLLRRLVPLLAPGAHVFIGDNRDATLLPLFCASVQLFRSDGTESLPALAMRAAQAGMEEPQLTVAPGYFRQLAAIGLHCVDLQCKRGRHRNEMTQFRYDATLWFGAAASVAAVPAPHAWRDGVDSLDAVCRDFEATGRAPRWLRGLPNARLRGAALLLEAAGGAAAGLHSTGQLRRSIDRSAPGEDPEDWWALGRELGVDLRVVPSGRADGRFDVGLNATDAGVHTPMPLASLANDPLLSLRAEGLAGEIRGALAGSLPSHAMPHFIVVLPHLPLTPNGKLDEAALPLPTRLRQARPAPRAATGPTGEAGEAGEAMVRRVAAVWENVLGIVGIAPEDDFFAIGGDSLRAVRVASQLSELLQRPISPAALFEHRELGALARHLTTPAPQAPADAAVGRGRQRRAAIGRPLQRDRAAV